MSETSGVTEAVEIDVKMGDFEAGLRAVVPHAGKDATLPMLMAVNLQSVDGSFVAAATQRYTLGVYRFNAEAPEGFGFLVARDDAVRLQKLAKDSVKVGVPVRLRVDGDMLTAAFPGSSVTVHRADGSFPAWPSLLSGAVAASKPGEGSFHAYNPSMLALFKAIDKRDYVRLYPSALNKPTLVTIGDQFAGIIMPIRDADTIPAWVSGL